MWDAGLRGAGIVLLLLLAVTGWRDASRQPAGRYAILFDLCATAFLIETAPALREQSPAWLMPVRVLSNAAPGAFLLWVAAIFDDACVPDWRRWIPFAAMAGLAGLAIATGAAWSWHAVHAAALLLIAAGLWLTVAGRAADLLEPRRRFRLVLAIGIGVWIAAVTLLGVLPGHAGRAAAGLISAGGVLVLALTAAVSRLRMAPSPVAAPALALAGAAAAPVALPVTAGAPDQGLLRRLETTMAAECAYRDEGLGVAQLAARMGIPEYRLRRLINQNLGHRNFTSFVNRYRLADAMAALGDPAQAKVPVLTIALDAGFRSIGPFNRAFKAHTGQTPTEFRRARLHRQSAAD